MPTVKSKLFLFSLSLFFFFYYNGFGQNKFNSRLFYVKPPLHDSKSKVTKFSLSEFHVVVASPVDHRDKFYGEEVYKNSRVHAMEEFFQSPTIDEIQKKMENDIKRFSTARARTANHAKIVISPTVEVFYPRVKFLRGKSFAKVRLGMVATLNDSLLISATYESFYVTDGEDKEFEGDLSMSIEEGTNVTVGMTLRKTLDQFYGDLHDALTRKDRQIVITGRIINSKTKTPLVGTIAFQSDSVYSTISSQDGRFKLVIPFTRHYKIQVQSQNFVTLSEVLTVPGTLKLLEKNFSLQPAKVGTVVSLKNILFYMGTTDLLEESYHELDGVVSFLKANSKIKIELQGHTDNQGDANKDLILSQQRVDKIKSYLVDKGISSRRITGKGFGGSKPIATNNSEEGRKLNRRVEFVIVKK
jgi:outer membrane protein OmpA-like peptidoglycan-associated protein